jgi:hypothetical protein
LGRPLVNSGLNGNSRSSSPIEQKVCYQILLIEEFARHGVETLFRKVLRKAHFVTARHRSHILLTSATGC